MRLACVLLAAVGAVSTTCALSQAAPEPPPQRQSGTFAPWTGPRLDETLVVVDGEEVPFATFASWLLLVQGRELRARFAEEVLLRRGVEDLGVAPTATDVEAATRAAIQRRIDEAFGGDPSRFTLELDQLGTTVERDFQQRSVLVGRALARTALARATRGAPDDAAIEAAYTRRFGPDGRELVVRVVRAVPVIPPLPARVVGDGGTSGDPADVPDASRETRERHVQRALREAENRLEAIAAEVRAGAAFAALARQRSEDPDSGPRGGLLPSPFERAAWPREVIAELARLAPGEPSRPLFARGFANLFLIESARAVPLAEVRDALAAELAAAEPDEVECRAAMLRLRAANAATFEWLDHEFSDPLAAGHDDLERPVLRFGDDLWTRADLGLWIARGHGGDLVRPFVRDLRLARRGAALGALPVPDAIEELADATFAATLQNVYGGDRARMARDHERRGITEEHLRAGFRREAWRALSADAVLRAQRQVEPDDVRRLWEERHGPLGKSFDVRLLVRHVDEITRAVELARLTDLARQARAGADFGALAARWSDDSHTRAQGGRALGRFRHELAPVPIATALLRMVAGETSEPIDLGSELVLLHLVDVRRVPLDRVRDELQMELRDRPATAEERMAYLQSLDFDRDCVYRSDLLFQRPPEKPESEGASTRAR